METFLLAIAVVALCVFGLCFNIIFRKDGKFPDGEISHNKELRRRGIVCAKEEELRLWGRKHNIQNPDCSVLGCSACSGCGAKPQSESEEK